MEGFIFVYIFFIAVVAIMMHEYAIDAFDELKNDGWNIPKFVVSLAALYLVLAAFFPVVLVLYFVGKYQNEEE